MSLVRAIRAQAERASPAFRDCPIPYFAPKAGWEFRTVADATAPTLSHHQLNNFTAIAMSPIHTGVLA